MSASIVSSVFGWFFSCPQVLAAALIYLLMVSSVFGLVGYAMGGR